VKEVWQFLKEHWPRVFLFLGLCLILGLGAYQLLFFVSDFAFDEDGEYSPRVTYSIIAGLGLTALGFHVYFKQKKDLKLLKDALQVLRYLDPEGFHILDEVGGGCMPKLRNNSLDSVDPNKDIALGLVLESEGALSKSRDDKERLAKILGQLDKSERLYESIKEMDDLILGNLEDRTKRKFPRQVYFLRLNLLTDFRDACQKEKFLIYSEHNEQFKDNEKVLCEFCKKALNQFYSNYKDYSPQLVDFDLRLFRKFFSDTEQEYPSNLKLLNDENDYEGES
jgi:hypothetical protein